MVLVLRCLNNSKGTVIGPIRFQLENVKSQRHWGAFNESMILQKDIHFLFVTRHDVWIIYLFIYF